MDKISTEYQDLATLVLRNKWLSVSATGYMLNYYQQEGEVADIVEKTEKILLNNLVYFELVTQYVTKEHWITDGMGQSY